MNTPPRLPDRPRLPWDPPDHFEKRVPDGDNRERLVCARCEFIHYQNPKIVAGAVCTWNDRILLAKRAIEPRKGFWTLPAGYMELGETTEQAAAARGPRRGLRHHRDRSPARHVQRGPHRPGADHVSRAAGERRRGGRRRRARKWRWSTGATSRGSSSPSRPSSGRSPISTTSRGKTDFATYSNPTGDLARMWPPRKPAGVCLGGEQDASLGPDRDPGAVARAGPPSTG